MDNCLFLFIGESFRLGNQLTRNRGSVESYPEQIKASHSHINFIDNCIDKFNIKKASVYISTYNTKYNDNLISIYEKYLLNHDIYDKVSGLPNNLFHKSILKIKNIEDYDFVFYIRIDLFLKQEFIDIFDPTIKKILFPTICWYKDRKCGKHPRVNDVMLFIPKKYYKYIKNFKIYHDNWYVLIETTDLTYEDLDTMIHTYHDSDSYKDFNPLYYIVNRPESKETHSNGYIFDKMRF
tara:strand:+ start:248 stop:958 length:711 start_codon:yes stop_codon:yes gene_type:complete